MDSILQSECQYTGNCSINWRVTETNKSKSFTLCLAKITDPKDNSHLLYFLDFESLLHRVSFDNLL